MPVLEISSSIYNTPRNPCFLFVFKIVEAYLNYHCPLDQKIVVLADLVVASSIKLIGAWSDESSANQICTSCKQSLKRPWNALQRHRQPWAGGFLCVSAGLKLQASKTTQQAPESELLLSSFQMSDRVREEIISGGSSATRLDAAQGQHARLNNCKSFSFSCCSCCMLLPLKPPEEQLQFTRQPMTSIAPHGICMLLCDVMTSSSTRRST